MPEPNANADWFPLEPEEHERQLDGLRRRFAGAPRRVLDLGAGDGRVARPLAAEGHTLYALDTDADALARCAAPNITTIHADARDPGALASIEPGLDAVLCLGHTFLLFADPIDALDLLRRLRPLLRAPDHATQDPGRTNEGRAGSGGGGGGGGVVILDAFPVPLWREIADGNWQEGVSEDANAQLLWAEGDNVIALRDGPDVDDRSWTLGPGDTPLRIWSRGELRLLAHAAGFAPPEAEVETHLLILRPHDRP